ncbi:hypothetical protein U6L75_11770 [Cutibacterium acnes]|nr:hypothetical protein OYC58_001436 [Cutibacterium acnes]
MLATASKKHRCTPGGQLGVLSSKLIQTNGSVSGNSTRKLGTYRLSLQEKSYLCAFLSYSVYPCQTQDDECHIPFPVNLREEEMPRYMLRPVITKATTIYPRTAGTSLTMPRCWIPIVALIRASGASSRICHLSNSIRPCPLHG